MWRVGSFVLFPALVGGLNLTALDLEMNFTRLNIVIPKQPVTHIALVAPQQHVCCRYGPLADKRDERAGVWAALPAAFNYEDMVDIKCTQTTKYTKEEAACHWCSCLWEEGAKKEGNDVYGKCCSLEQMNKAGNDAKTGWPFCKAITHAYNLQTDLLRSCELNIDLYDFAAFKNACAGDQVSYGIMAFAIAYYSYTFT
eukprot:GEMP01069231.1.p1 GENE.GEMP01069231.1~~GEMP01069231.1.p1  ORF type:complete len:198 (+),score=34.19 GEMP01069231.1:64-657(+)